MRNYKPLIEFVAKSKTAANVLESFTKRSRITTFTNIVELKRRLLRQGVELRADDYVQLWNLLHDLNFGTALYNKNQKMFQFKWNCSLISVAQHVFQELNKIPKKVVEEPKEVINDAKKRLYTITLADGSTVEVIAPKTMDLLKINKIRSVLIH